MIYKHENQIVEVYFLFIEEFNAGHITHDNIGEYVYTDVLFPYSDTIRNKYLEDLKLKIELYYSQKDSTGRIESLYPYYFP